MTSEVSELARVTKGREGGRVGTVTYTAGPLTEQVELELAHAIPPPDAWWRLTHPGELLGW